MVGAVSSVGNTKLSLMYLQALGTVAQHAVTICQCIERGETISAPPLLPAHPPTGFPDSLTL
jgi:hypothetical protein